MSLIERETHASHAYYPKSPTRGRIEKLGRNACNACVHTPITPEITADDDPNMASLMAAVLALQVSVLQLAEELK